MVGERLVKFSLIKDIAELIKKKFIVLDETFGISFPIDIVIRIPDEIEERLRENDFFIEKVLRDGIPL
jgi:hypothetical protein